jgi:hypothetical protein
MSSIEDQPNPAPRRGARAAPASGAWARAPTALVAALVLLIGLVALALRPPSPSSPVSSSPELSGPPGPSSPVTPSPALSGSPGSGSAASPPEPGAPGPATAGSSASGSRAALAARLRQILDVREQAFGRRDMDLLETVYTADCPCLHSGRAAIARLLADRAVWRGRAVAVDVTSLERLSDRVWAAVALFSSRPFRIEREDGTLIRAVPAERHHYRFVLAQPTPAGPWLLGDASLLEAGGT